MTYADLVAKLPRPTPEQTAAFVDFVAGAHSWYKHLPVWPPGVPFFFFLDPNAGRSLVHLPTGDLAFVDKDDEKDRFHYTWMFTSEYRKRFGHWTYFTAREPGFYCGSNAKGWAELSTRARVLDDEGNWVPVSAEVGLAGTCLLTGLMHELFNPRLSVGRNEGSFNDFKTWAQAHPEDPAAQRHAPVVAYLDAVEKTTTSEEYKALNREIEPFLDAERTRQRALMHDAMRRVLAF